MKRKSPRNKPVHGSKKSKSYSIKPVTAAVQHSEGPHWDENNENLYFVDTFKATIYRWDSMNDKTSSHKLDNHNSVGVIIPIKDEKEEFVVAADRSLYRFKWPKEGIKLKTEARSLALLDKDKPKNQCNDGKADSYGRLWIGTLTRNEDLSVSPKGGSLFTLKCGDTIKVDEKISNTSISNGLAWSKNNKKMYHIDSLEKNVYEYDYEEKSGNISNRKIVFKLSNHPELQGIPDGMTIDVQDNLWIALFGGHSVINVNPKTGKLINIVKMPVTYVTSACFGGTNLDILFVTTSKLHLKEKQLVEEPDAGSVFAIENLGVKGLPGNRAKCE
ncbi:hypothetical protein JTB14_017653 [Gonioctena quinquepunctata]|nr:hypothetical protein JTB14_017653 [Gonioctena quinquepunctata]